MSKIARLLKNDDLLLKICTEPIFSIRKTMIVLLSSITQILTRFGALQGSNGCLKRSKIARLLKNDDLLLKICTEPISSIRKTMIVLLSSITQI